MKKKIWRPFTQTRQFTAIRKYNCCYWSALEKKICLKHLYYICQSQLYWSLGGVGWGLPLACIKKYKIFLFLFLHSLLCTLSIQHNLQTNFHGRKWKQTLSHRSRSINLLALCSVLLLRSPTAPPWAFVWWLLSEFMNFWPYNLHSLCKLQVLYVCCMLL